MISTNDMRPGMTLDLDGDLFTIVNYQHHKPGKGGAMVRTKLKNVKTGAVTDRTFRADEKVELARLDKREMQFLYSDEESYVFMDNESFEQMHIDKDFVGDASNYLKEGDKVQIPLYQGVPIGLDLPTTVDLTITETDPGLQGDRSSAGTKPATLETGAIVQVPLFIVVGETIRVDTRTGSYVTRVR
ncbi:MAG TPA: elongation factor P [Actinomycetota bacterium]|nr:elongation factor P [Actinomycetota bacterium]